MTIIINGYIYSENTSINIASSNWTGLRITYILFADESTRRAKF